jgi:hypothetical protein
MSTERLIQRQADMRLRVDSRQTSRNLRKSAPISCPKCGLIMHKAPEYYSCSCGHFIGR